jgi:hypothetical protein
MTFGKLGVLKSYGEKPTFAILDEDGQPETIIPQLDVWLIERLGNDVSIFISDTYFQISDYTTKRARKG